MLDWKITEEALPEDPQNDTPPRRRPRWRGWLAAVVVLLVVGVGGWYYTQRRIDSGETAMRQDLLDFIDREFLEQWAGGPAAASKYAVPDAPTDWLEHYQSTFTTVLDIKPLLDTTDDTTPLTTTLEPFELINDTAYVTVWGEDGQRRAYRLTPEGWRRAPLGSYDFGANATLGGAASGVTVNYRESDGAFAEQFFADIARFEPLIAQSTGTLIPSHTIQIEPTELRGALVQSAGPAAFLGLTVRRRLPPTYTLIVNSPQTVEIPTYWGISSESAIRYTYAIWALQQLRPDTDTVSPLPNYDAFVAASQQVLALRWALTPEEFERVAARWRRIGTGDATTQTAAEASAETWTTPFSPLAVIEAGKIDAFYPAPMQARLLAVANVVYSKSGSERLSTMIAPSPTSATSWDAFFAAADGDTTLTMEAQARGDATTPIIPTLPLTGKIVVPPMLDEGPTVDNLTGGVYLQPDDGSAPIWIDGWDNATITMPRPDTTPLTLPGSCLPLFSQVTIDGEWSDAGVRLTAATITALSNTPPNVYRATTAPPESVALVADNAASSTYGSATTTITSLLPDGTRTPVVENQRTDPRLFTAFGLIERGGVLMLPQPTLAHDCNATWLSQYVPSRGISGNWLVAWEDGMSAPIWFWDAPTEEGNRQGILFLDNGDPTRPIPYWRLYMGTTKVLGEPDGFLPSGRPRLLRPGAQEVLVQQENPTRYQLISLSTGEVVDEYTPPPDQIASELVFTSNGSALVMAVSYTADNSLRSTVWRYDFETKQTTTLWEPTLGAIYNLAADQNPARMAVYATTSADVASHYLMVLGAGSQYAEPKAIARDSADARLLSHLACQNRGVGYLSAAPTADTSTPAAVSLNLMSSLGGSLYDPIPLLAGDTFLMCWT